jgi:hypothetical protein
MDQSTLEGMVDTYGLNLVLEMLSEICGEKGEHLRANWQDEIAARRWDKAARRLDKQAYALAGLAP